MSTSRKRIAPVQLSSPGRTKRTNPSRAANKAAQRANKDVRTDENGLLIDNPKRGAVSASKPAPIGTQRAQQPVEKPMDVEITTPKYSFETCPYAEDIYQTQLQNEMKFFGRIGQGIEWEAQCTKISPQMRTILVNWLIEVAEEYKLRKETLFIAINYIDRFLQNHVHNVERNCLQLIGITCVLIAAKYEEIEVPRVDELVYITDSTYNSKQILDTEKILLNDLDFDLTVSTIISFLPLYLEVAGVCDEAVHAHAHFLADLTLTCYKLHVSFPPSLLAAAIVILSRHTFDETDLWSPHFLSFTRRNRTEIQRCAREIWAVYSKAFAPGTRPMAVIEKYRTPKYYRVGNKYPTSTPPV